MSVGRGTDGYTEFWRNCLCGANCNSFKPCLLENLRWKRYITLQGFLAFWCFLWMRLQAGSGPCGASRFIQVTIRVWVTSSWATSNPTTCVYHVFSGLWFGFWSGCRQAELHDSINEINFQKINISQDFINYSQSFWMSNNIFYIWLPIIFFA